MAKHLDADRQAFLDAIRARPLDALPRMIFADWLEERGERRKAAHYRRAALRLPDVNRVPIGRAWRRIGFAIGDRMPHGAAYWRRPAPGETRDLFFVSMGRGRARPMTIDEAQRLRDEHQQSYAGTFHLPTGRVINALENYITHEAQHATT